MRFLKQTRLTIYLSVLLLSVPTGVFAQSSSSSNYRVDQTIFGTGGDLDATSPNYRSRITIGELTIGNTASPNYQAYAGFNTTDEPYLEMVVTAANIDLGYLDTAAARTANATFYVRAWQAGSYSVRTVSNPPTNTSGGYQLTPLASPTASAAGTEQFGINLVANTSPTTFGANPQQVPDNTFSFGAAAVGYNTANQYKYVKNDIVAQSTKSTSVTIYTLSYIFNINNATPAGQYTFSHNLVATGTY
jgi:hypothetical protein